MFQKKIQGKSSVKNEKLDLRPDLLHSHNSDRIRRIREDIIGTKARLLGPFGSKSLTYCDYIASGRSLKSFENFIQREVSQK